MQRNRIYNQIRYFDQNPDLDLRNLFFCFVFSRMYIWPFKIEVITTESVILMKNIY
jgi:hypothetical protein